MSHAFTTKPLIWGVSQEVGHDRLDHVRAARAPEANLDLHASSRPPCQGRYHLLHQREVLGLDHIERMPANQRLGRETVYLLDRRACKPDRQLLVDDEDEL